MSGVAQTADRTRPVRRAPILVYLALILVYPLYSVPMQASIHNLVPRIGEIGARVVTNQQVRVHVSGHAYSGELLFLYNAVRPRNVMPVHGTWRMLRANAKLAARAGVPEESIVLAENGVSVDLVSGKASIAGAVPVGKWVGETYRRQPMIVPTVIEI